MRLPNDTAPVRVDVRAHARRGASAKVWLADAAVAVAGLAALVWSVNAMALDPESSSLAPPLVLVGAFMLLLVAAIFAWFELQRVTRFRRADEIAPGSLAIPFLIAKQLPSQVSDVAEFLGQKPRYLSSPSYGLLVADAAGVRILSGWAFATDLCIPRASLKAVELGAIEFPLGPAAVSVDVILDSRSDLRVSFMPMRTSRRYAGHERSEIIGQYVEELRRKLDLQ